MKQMDGLNTDGHVLNNVCQKFKDNKITRCGVPCGCSQCPTLEVKPAKLAPILLYCISTLMITIWSFCCQEIEAEKNLPFQFV